MLIEYSISVTGGVVTVTQRIEPGQRAVALPAPVRPETVIPDTKVPPGTSGKIGEVTREAPPLAKTKSEAGKGPVDKSETGGGLPASGLVIAFGPVVFLGAGTADDDDGAGSGDKTGTEGAH